MSDYSSAVAQILQQANAAEAALPVKHEACRSRFFFQPDPAPKVCLFFHGFTACPYQFEPLGEALFAAGYNVLIPLLPGHGQAGDWNADAPPPLPIDRQVYQDFALHWLEQAQSLGKQIVIGGLSSGATLAAWLAMEQAQAIDRTLVFAPYLSSNSKVIDLLVEVLPFYFEWFDKDAPGHFGYDGFPIPTLRLFLDMGQEILQQVQSRSTAPMLIISSESDPVTSRQDHHALFEAVLQHQPQSWYHCFDKIFNIPHTMMTQIEGNHYQSLLITLAKAYIESDLAWSEVQEISYRVRQGEPITAVIADLNVSQQTSLDLLTIIESLS